MGQILGFYCTNCDYAASVAGGDSAGRIATTTTIYCDACRTLQDVVTSEIDYQGNVHERLTRCRRAKSHSFHPWIKGAPCPRCAGVMELTGEETLWA
jgi:hypothetical protein